MILILNTKKQVRPHVGACGGAALGLSGPLVLKQSQTQLKSRRPAGLGGRAFPGKAHRWVDPGDHPPPKLPTSLVGCLEAGRKESWHRGGGPATQAALHSFQGTFLEPVHTEPAHTNTYVRQGYKYVTLTVNHPRGSLPLPWAAAALPLNLRETCICRPAFSARAPPPPPPGDPQPGQVNRAGGAEGKGPGLVTQAPVPPGLSLCGFDSVHIP